MKGWWLSFTACNQMSANTYLQTANSHLCGCPRCRCAALLPLCQSPQLEDRGHLRGDTVHPPRYTRHQCAWYCCTPSIPEVHWPVEEGSGGQWAGCRWRKCMGLGHRTWWGRFTTQFGPSRFVERVPVLEQWKIITFITIKSWLEATCAQTPLHVWVYGLY